MHNIDAGVGAGVPGEARVIPVGHDVAAAGHYLVGLVDGVDLAQEYDIVAGHGAARANVLVVAGE